MVQRDCVMDILLSVCPSFSMKWGEHLKDIWDRNSETILYTDLTAFVRHLSYLADVGYYKEFNDIFNKIEFIIVEGDIFVQEAIVVGLLEDIQNIFLSNKQKLSIIEKYLKPETKKYWDGISKYFKDELS